MYLKNEHLGFKTEYLIIQRITQMRSTTPIEIKVLKSTLYVLRLRNGLDVAYGLAVCPSILPAMLLPVADVSMAANDADLKLYLFCPTNAQSDSDRVKTPTREAC